MGGMQEEEQQPASRFPAVHPEHPRESITDDQIIAVALNAARLSGWMVATADCRVQVAASESRSRGGEPDAWLVQMWALPSYNAVLQSQMPLACRVELIEGVLCGVSVYEPADRKRYRVQP